MKFIAILLTLALLGCASIKSTYDTPEKRAAIGKALLNDAQTVLRPVEIAILSEAVKSALGSGKADYVHAAAAALNASLNAANVRQVIDDATGGAVPALADAAANVIITQLGKGVSGQTALQAVASAISGLVMTK